MIIGQVRFKILKKINATDFTDSHRLNYLKIIEIFLICGTKKHNNEQNNSKITRR